MAKTKASDYGIGKWILLVLLQDGDTVPIRFYLVPAEKLKGYPLDKMHGKDVNFMENTRTANQICKLFCRCLGDIGEVTGWDGVQDLKNYKLDRGTEFMAQDIVILRWAI